MKSFLSIAFALALSMGASAQNSSLNCKISGVEDGKTVALALIDGYNTAATYQATVQNGEAVMKFDIEGPRGFRLIIDNQNTYEIIALGSNENATLVANYDGKKVSDIKVSGSMTNMEYQIKMVDRESLDKRYAMPQSLPIYVEYTKAYAAKDQEKMKEIQASADWQEFNKAQKWFFDEVERQYKGAQEANKDSWLGPFFMLTNYSYLTKEQLTEWEKFSPEVQQSFYGKVTHDMIVPPSLEGKQMPDFTFTNYATKKKSSLAAVLKKNKYVLIDFWASWCKPCRAEIPNVKANYEKYHKKGFDVISISADKREADWLKALKEENLPWWNDRDAAQGICDLYKVQYYPTIYLLDNEGKVIAKDIRGEALGEKLAELLK